MKIEKYVAPTMSEALAKVKADLGKDAVILQTRKISKGRAFDFFGREMVEVTAAKPQPRAQGTGHSDDTQDAWAQNVSANRARNVSFREHLQQRVQETYGRDVESRTAERPLVQESRSLGAVSPIEEFRTELQEVRAALTGLQGGMADLQVAMQDIFTYMKHKSVAHLPRILQRFFITLTHNGVEDELAKSLLEEVYTDVPSIGMADRNAIKGALIQRIAEEIRTATLAEAPDRRPGQHSAQCKVVAFIGPTGVGKTATLAKLAVKSKTQQHRQIAIISTDIYKMAAAKQWEAFGEMMDIPIEQVYAPEEIKQAVNRHHDKDIVLIDTVGRSQNDPKLMAELSTIINEAQPTETHLVLSVTAKDIDTLRAIEQFSSISTDYLVFTKLDETQTVGTLLNVVHTTGKPLSYITNGPSITGDLAIADAFELARMILDDREVDKRVLREADKANERIVSYAVR